MNDDNIISWFIGFVEGDGSFVINRNGYLEFKITQSSYDVSILYFIKERLGFGQVRVQDKLQNTHHFRVRDKTNLLKIITLFNGRLILEKRRVQFNKWLTAFNLKYKMSVDILQHHLEPALSNAWLSGFTDAEGCFTFSLIFRNPTYTQVLVRYIVSQKDERIALEKIALLFQGRISYLKSYGGYNMTVNFSNLKKVIEYFSKYPLLSNKRIVFQNWLKVYHLVLTRQHLTHQGLEEIKKLKIVG